MQQNKKQKTATKQKQHTDIEKRQNRTELNRNKKHKGLKLVGRMDITSKNLKQIRTVKFPFNNFISFFTNF